MRSSVEVETSALDFSPTAQKLRQILVPLDLTSDSSASIDYAIHFAIMFRLDSKFTSSLSGAVCIERGFPKPQLRFVQAAKTKGFCGLL